MLSDNFSAMTEKAFREKFKNQSITDVKMHIILFFSSVRRVIDKDTQHKESHFVSHRWACPK